MIYPFHCYDCDTGTEVESRPLHPPKAPRCACGKAMDRVFGCQIDTSGCRDHDDVAPEHRIAVSHGANLTSGQVNNYEAAHRRKIEQTRRDLVDGGNKGSLRMTHQIPAALHAAKIKETGDREYWEDPKNRNRHKSCKVS